VDSIRAVLENARLIISATTSREPVIRGSLIGENTFIVSIGAPKPVTEFDEETLKKAGCLLVDTREGFLSEAGEAKFLNNVKVNLIDLRTALAEGLNCRWGEIRLYKSVGTALFDLAAVLSVLEKAGRKT
jgi:alanine dehydrogenase